MRFMVLIKADPQTEAGVMPSEEIVAAMTDYNEQLVRAGVLLAAEGLHPSSHGAKVTFSDAGTKVVDGPFTESKEVIAGFWMLQCKSLEECVEWVKRSPMGGMTGSGQPDQVEVEIREIFAADEFGAQYDPELRERERRIGEQMADNARARN